jgi:PKD repeat protein
MGVDRRFGRAISVSRPRGAVPSWTIALGMAAVALLAIPVIGRASDAVDQSLPGSTIPNVINSTKVMAQTFTAGTTGQIDKLTLSLETHSNPVSGWLEIRPVGAGGTPTGGTLQPTSTSIVITFPFGNTPHDFAISPAVPVTAGTQYAIVWTTKVGTAYWWGTGFDVYTGGQQWLACIGCGWTPNASRDFAFATWVASVTNHPAAVSADHPDVTVTEGTAPANTGTFSDPDGDTVAITASSGTITKTGTGSGTWSWHGVAADEGTTQTITVTANDGKGVPSTTSFSVNVIGAPPTAHIGTLASTSPEGTALSLTGWATSPSTEDTTAGFVYGWKVTKNGNAYASGAGARWRFTPNDDGTYVITLTATDDGNMSDTASATVIATNVPPTVTITAAGTTTLIVVTANLTLDFRGSFTDPGADTYTYRWLFGDGASSSALSTTHSYSAAGTYHASLTVTDDDGGVGVATATVIVQSPQLALSAIEAYVNGISTLTKGQKASLIAKLEAASAAAARGNNLASHNDMSAFLNEVRAYVKTGNISAAQQTTLTDAIHAVEAAIGTYNRMLQWWPLEP